MGIGQSKSWVLVVALGMLASSAAPAKSLNEKNPPSDSTKEESAASEAAKKQVLIDATRVSTSEVVKSAAKEAATTRPAVRVSDDPGDSDVLEFRSVRQTTDASAGALAAPSKASKKSSPKKIHGEAYGLAGSANRGAGGAVGASSKSGKTAIYVEADHSRTTSPPPR